MNHEQRLRKVTAAHNTGLLKLRQARDAAVLEAHEDGLSYQAIATICDMSMENVRRIVREQRALTSQQ